MERLTYRYLSAASNRSVSSLQRLFRHYLSHPPTFQIRSRSQVHLIIDGTYFSNDLCLVLYRDNDIKYTQLYRFSDGEHYEEIKEDLQNLALLGIEIASVTCDGKRAILKAVRESYPEVILQRCVVHVHRMGNLWLRKKPKTEASISLKELLNKLPLVETHNDRRVWQKAFRDWYELNKDFVNEKARSEASGRWWYRHKNLRRTTVMIRNAMPNLFPYLDDPRIPKSTNALESFFGHLKDSLSIHRGLAYHNRKAFIIWYLHLKNKTRR